MHMGESKWVTLRNLASSRSLRIREKKREGEREVSVVGEWEERGKPHFYNIWKSKRLKCPHLVFGLKRILQFQMTSKPRLESL